MQSSIVINAVDSERTGTVGIFAMRSVVIMLTLMINSRIIFYILTLVYAIRSVQHNNTNFITSENQRTAPDDRKHVAVRTFIFKIVDP